MALLFSDLQATEDYLASIVNYEWVTPGQRPERAFKLERVGEAMELLGIASPDLPAIHIGGTKGKGSTIIMMDAILRAHGLHTGAFMSPHVSTIRERILIEGVPISELEWVEGFNAIAPILEEMTIRGRRLTYFEVTWILALQRFRFHKPDAVLIEVGMGGRLDCTNLIQPRVAVMMPISHDHTTILGKRISQIAWDKSHILKPGAMAIIAKQSRWARSEILSRINSNHIEALWYGDDYELTESGSGEEPGITFDVKVGNETFDDLRLSLLGSHQRRNAAVAIAAVRCFLKTMNQELDPVAARQAVEDVSVPGRLEWAHRNPDVLLDVAHNPASFRALTATLAPLKGSRKIHAIVAFAKGKDSRKCLKILAPFVDGITLVPNGTPRTQDPARLWDIAAQIGMKAKIGSNGVTVLQESIEAARNDLILVTGSFPLVGDCRNYVNSL